MLTLFYLFLGLILLFYYLPTPNRPESAFLRAWRDWRRRGERSLCGDEALSRPSLERMKLHAGKIDRDYFDGVDFDALERYLNEAERLTILTELYREVRRRLAPKLRHEIEGAECRVRRRLDAKEMQRYLEERKRRMEEKIRRLVGDRRLSAKEWGRLAEYVTIGRHTLQSRQRLLELEAQMNLSALKRSRF
jgi:hypothetical protein